MASTASTLVVLGVLAQSGAFAESSISDPRARPRLICEFAALVPGATTMLGISFDIDEHWHLYWNGYNDAGMAPKATWTMPKGFAVGQLQWPAPTRQLMGQEILNHIYEKRVTLLVPITVPESAEAGSRVEIAADLRWLVCEEACIVEEGRVAITLPVLGSAESPHPGAPEHVRLIQEARERLPKPMPIDGSLSLTWAKGVCTITSEAAASLAFFPGPECSALIDTIASTQAKGPILTLKPEEIDSATRLEGVIQLTPKGGGKPAHYALDFKPTEPLAATPAPTAPKEKLPQEGR
jgi:DsbC/DsbD-like thiol-disulfide interchange protein